MTIKEYLDNPTGLALGSHIKRRYVPIIEKRTAAEIVARVSCYDKDGKFRQDSIERYVWERIMLLDLYTDFERSKNMLEDFDLADEFGLFEKIADAIPRREREEFTALVEMACADAVRNEYEIGAFLRKQVERFGQLVGVGLENLDTEKIVEVLKRAMPEE